MSARATRQSGRAPIHPDEPDEATLDEAMELIHFAFRRVVEAPDRVLEARGMGRLHHRLLFVIGKNPGIDVTQMLELLGITKQAGNAPLRELVEADLVRVERPEEDRRRKLLTLTATGKRFERRLATLQHRVFAQAFAETDADAVEGWRIVMDLLGGGRRLRV